MSYFQTPAENLRNKNSQSKAKILKGVDNDENGTNHVEGKSGRKEE